MNNNWIFFYLKESSKVSRLNEGKLVETNAPEDATTIPSSSKASKDPKNLDNSKEGSIEESISTDAGKTNYSVQEEESRESTIESTENPVAPTNGSSNASHFARCLGRLDLFVKYYNEFCLYILYIDRLIIYVSISYFNRLD